MCYVFTPLLRNACRYSLRLLLHHVPGAKSYADVRTVDGIVYGTFEEAALKHGLLEDDREWDECLREAASTQMPIQLRQLFATLLTFNNPVDPGALWEAHKVDLTEDILREARQVRTAPNNSIYQMNEDIECVNIGFTQCRNHQILLPYESAWFFILIPVLISGSGLC